MLNFAQSTERFGKIYNNNLKSTKSTTFNLQFKIGWELPLSLKVYAVFKCFQAKLTSVTCTPHHHNLSCFTNFTLFAKVLVQNIHFNGQKPAPIFKCLNKANLVWYFFLHVIQTCGWHVLCRSLWLCNLSCLANFLGHEWFPNVVL